jgi:ABC-type bacteriocin/lantibiotic exporter with double-glycine peptidase domain
MGGLIVWVVGGRQVIQGYGLSLGSLMAFLNYLTMFYAPMTNLSQLTDWVTRFLTAAQRAGDVASQRKVKRTEVPRDAKVTGEQDPPVEDQGFTQQGGARDQASESAHPASVLR